MRSGNAGQVKLTHILRTITCTKQRTVQIHLPLLPSRATSRRKRDPRSELFGTRQRAHARLTAIALHNLREARPGDELHDLSEQYLADVQGHSQG